MIQHALLYLVCSSLQYMYNICRVPVQLNLYSFKIEYILVSDMFFYTVYILHTH